jgi:hypothetical protein
MIYMVDHVYADPATEPAWHEWYAGYLRKLVSVPGLHTAQRFKALGCAPSRYLAMYSIDSADVFTSEAYKGIGGGGSQSARFHGAYQLWTRNLFDAMPQREARSTDAIWAPPVQSGQRVLVFDRDALPRPQSSASAQSNQEALESRATWLAAVGLHRTTKYRAFIVLGQTEAATVAAMPGAYLYQPFTALITSASWS